MPAPAALHAKLDAVYDAHAKVKAANDAAEAAQTAASVAHANATSLAAAAEKEHSDFLTSLTASFNPPAAPAQPPAKVEEKPAVAKSPAALHAEVSEGAKK